MAEREAPANVGHNVGRDLQTTVGGRQTAPSPSHPQKQPSIVNASTPKAGSPFHDDVFISTEPNTENEDTVTLRCVGVDTNDELFSTARRHILESDGTYDTL